MSTQNKQETYYATNEKTYENEKNACDMQDYDEHDQNVYQSEHQKEYNKYQNVIKDENVKKISRNFFVDISILIKIYDCKRCLNNFFFKNYFYKHFK